MRNDHKDTSRRMLYEDNLFREAVKETARIEGEKLLGENEKLGPDAGVSLEKQEEFKNRLEKALHDKKNRVKRTAHIKMVQRVAVIVLVLSAVLTVSLFSVDAFRIKLLNFFMEIKPEYTEFRLEEENKNENEARLVNWSNAYIPTYMPLGYSVESSENNSTFKSILFQDADGQIISYDQYSESVNFNYDTEGAILRDIEINGESGTLVIKGDDYSIIWKHENLIFVVRTQINEQETLKIAESVKFIK